MLDRQDYWQAGYVIPKGTYPELRREGIESLRRGFAELIPEYADRIEHLDDWKQASLLSVESSICPRWYRPGLLLRSEEHTSELQSRQYLVCRLLLEKKKQYQDLHVYILV